MADITLQAVPVLGGVDKTLVENRIVERSDLAIVSVATPCDGGEALASALQNGWALEMPSHTRSTTIADTRAVRTASDQLLLFFQHDTPDANSVVQGKLAGAGYTTDQTDSWVVLEVSGPDTLAALERICPLDLHSQNFPVNASARTIMEHMGAIIIRLDPEKFLLLSASSSSGSFLHAVETSYHYVVS